MDQETDRWIGSKLAHITHVALYHRNLRLTCPRCRRSRVLNAASLWKLFSRRQWNDDLRQAARRFHCSECLTNGTRIRPKITITQDDHEGPQYPMPDQFEWRRLTSRYRS